MTFIRSTKHQLYTIKQSKIGLSRYDDKRFIALDGINTKAHGHYSLIDAKDEDGDDDDDAAINTNDADEDVSIVSDKDGFDDDVGEDIDDSTMVLECSKFDDINNFNDSDNDIMVDAVAAVEDHNTNDVSINGCSEFNSDDDPILLHAISKLEDKKSIIDNFNNKKRKHYWDKIVQNKKKKCFKISMGCEDRVSHPINVLQGSSSDSDICSE